MGVTVLGGVFDVPVRVNIADGIQYGIRPGIDVFIRGRDIGAEAQRVVELTGKYGNPSRNVAHVRVGFVFQLEDRRHAERNLPDRVHMPHRYCTHAAAARRRIEIALRYLSCSQIPESPVWLVAKGKNDKAEKAMCWLRGWVEPEMVRHEFLELIHYNEVSGTRGSKGHVEKKKGLLAKLAEFKEPSVYRPMKLMMALFFVSNVVSLFHTRPFITKIMTNIYIVDNQNELLVTAHARRV
jgi:hypothetical protein